MTLPTITMLDRVRDAVARARAKGITVGPAAWGVLDVYTSKLTLLWAVNEDMPSICPMGALAMASPPVLGKNNSRARRADKIIVCIALATNLHPDYVHGFAQAYDGYQKWPGFEYSADWLRGFADGTAFRQEDLSVAA